MKNKRENQTCTHVQITSIMQTAHAGMLKYLKINGVGNLETKRMFI